MQHRIKISFFSIFLLFTNFCYSGDKRIALVIGNSDYTQVPKLSNTLNDADDMAKALKEFGFEVIIRKNATKRNMTDALSELGKRSKGAEAALLYYAGHGMQVRGENYLLPVNVGTSSEAAIIDESVSMNRVLDELEGGAHINMVMLDACRDNPITGKYRSAGRGLAATTSVPKGTVIVYATDPGNTAADSNDGGRNGMFTASMLRALKGNDLSLQGVLTSASAEVDRISEGKQVPYVNGPPHLQREFRFRVTVEPGPVSLESDFWGSVKDSTDTADFEAYLTRYPDGNYKILALNRLKKLRFATKSVPPVTPPKSKEEVTAPAVALIAKPPLPAGKGFKDCQECPEMLSVRGGNFVMGSDETKRNLYISSGGSAELAQWESPAHSVSIQPFSASKSPITKAQFSAFVAATGYRTDAEKNQGCFVLRLGQWKSDEAFNWANPGFQQGNDHPVVCVSWHDAKHYVEWLNNLPSISQNGDAGKYRLLSEAEREYITRAGTDSVYWWGNVFQTKMASFFKPNDLNSTVSVQHFPANQFGFLGVHGNTWDWVEDCFHDSYESAPNNGSAWVTACTSSDARVLRGGSWSDVPRGLRSSNRNKNIPEFRVSFVGFRIAKSW